ncbi:MAG TPA: CoA transferase [Syntrophorhabdaceae bacterium]|nr:CoA transferase [Syntrophorhabdaceae bacterium]
MLSKYRVLDLTDEKGFLCGKIMGDLGADVIKIEKPGGDNSRRIGPFFHNTVDPERGLNWFALNASKRGITLNLEDARGKEIFMKLADTADVVIESFSAGYLDELGVGYEALHARNPKVIMTSITPFGQSGPYKNRKASDITLLAMSGFLSINGDSDRPPLRMCLDQSYYLASAHAAAGTLLAIHCRYASGKGQHVDASIYEIAVRANYREPFRWEWEKAKTPRMGNRFARGGKGFKQLWPSKDGYVTWLIMMENPKPVRGWVEWMKEEGTAGRWADINWDGLTSFVGWSDEDVQAIQDSIAAFIATHTTSELAAGSMKRGLLLSPVNSVDLVAQDEQLTARGFWKQVAHPELKTSFAYPRFTYLTSEDANEVRFRAPLIGEHNAEIYGKELGLSEQDMASLTKQGVL